MRKAYLKAVMQMVAEKTLRIDPADGQCHGVTNNLAGFVDNEYYYIRLERTLQEANRYYDRLNQPLNVTADALSKLLMDEKILSAEQTRKLLHISKRKCAYLLEHQIIPCEITDRKTHRYLVREEDVLAYAEHADEIILPPVFSSASGKSHRKEPDPRIGKSAFLWIWATEPDALTPADVQRMTGYTGSTVRQWIRKGKLRSVTVQGRSLVAKEWLTEFMAGYGERIWQKSEVHLRLTDRISQIE